jgi:hypothetical protein
MTQGPTKMLTTDGSTLNNVDSMIDIETLSTEPNAIVLSIGAVLFDPYAENTAEDLSEYTFYQNITIESQKHRHLSKDTQEWWTQQDPAAWEALKHDQKPLVKVLENLYHFHCTRTGLKLPKVHRVWANSPSFDCVILDSAYRHYERFFQFPIPFWNWRDCRTVLDIAYPPGDDTRPHIRVGQHHNALDDCISQALMVQDAYRALNRAYGK